MRFCFKCTVREGKTSPDTSWSNSEWISLTRKFPFSKRGEIINKKIQQSWQNGYFIVNSSNQHERQTDTDLNLYTT